MAFSTLQAYLQGAITCSTVLTSGNLMLANQNVSYAVSQEPWHLLSILAPVPGNCATLVIDDATGYFDSLSSLSKTRIRVNVILLSGLGKNASQLLMSLENHQPNYVVTVVEHEQEDIAGSYTSQYFDSYFMYLYNQTPYKLQFQVSATDRLMIKMEGF